MKHFLAVILILNEKIKELKLDNKELRKENKELNKKLEVYRNNIRGEE